MELRRYWEVFCRRKRLFLLVTGGIVILTLLWAFLTPRIYKATTKVFVKMQDSSASVISIAPSSLGKLEYTTSSNVIGTVKEMIKNKNSLKNVIDELKLVKRSGVPFSSDELLDFNLLNISIYHTGVKVAQISDSDIIEIIGFSKDPELAVKISTALTSNSLEKLKNLNREEIMNTIDILFKEASRLKHLVDDSDITIRKYLISNEAINISEKASEYVEELVSAELSLAKLSTEKKEAHPEFRGTLRKYPKNYQ